MIDIESVPAEHRDTIARWLLERSDRLKPSWILGEQVVRVVHDMVVGMAVDLAEPGWDDTTVDHAVAVIRRLRS